MSLARPSGRLASLRRGLIFMAALCTAIALLLTVLYGQPAAKFVYSFAIGLSCWAATDLPRLALSAWLSTRAQRRGEAPAGRPGFELGWAGMLPLIVIGVALGPPVGLAIGDAITGGHSAPVWDLGSRGTQVTLLITLLAMLVTVVVRSAQERASVLALRAEAAQREAAEAQLRLLQSQLEPHMLFNTLANLRVLIGLEPARAQAMLDRLIAFLRSTLAASRVDRHALADEFARLDDYLALMQVRMGPRLRVELDLPVPLGSRQVPPLLLQPLVENAIKHGLEPKVDGGTVRVAALLEDGDLVLRVTDDGLGLGSGLQPADRDGGGFGLAQVRESLAARFRGRATLRLQAAPGGQGTLAEVRLPGTDTSP